MCRLFAVRATEPFPVKAAFHTLSAQSHEHKDGWGLAQYDSGEPMLERDVAAAYASNRFAELSATLRSANLLVHLRLASVGEVVERNSHPFRHDRWTFAHNGTVKKFQSAPGLVEERIAPELRPLIRGETDSERCFYLFLTHLKGGTEAADVTRALRQDPARCRTAVRRARQRPPIAQLHGHRRPNYRSDQARPNPVSCGKTGASPHRQRTTRCVTRLGRDR